MGVKGFIAGAVLLIVALVAFGALIPQFGDFLQAAATTINHWGDTVRGWFSRGPAPRAR